MFGNCIQDQASRCVIAAVPARASDVARLRVLLSAQRLPVVTVIGKYNHGKSRLLNELIGRETFLVADKRETVALAEHVHDGVRWLDAPGLDADVSAGDDDFALQAIWLKSDIRLFVHAAKEGELDAGERELLHVLRQDGERTRRQTLFVLSQVDQLAGDDQLRQVTGGIRSQAPGLEIQSVSSTRYRQGLDGGKQLLLEKSGIPALQAALKDAVANVPQAQAHERARLFSDIEAELQQLRVRCRRLLATLQRQQMQQRLRFRQDLTTVLDKVAADIQAMLDAPGPDHSLAPDSFETMFKITAGKLERNRLQVAYSRACIAISAVLTRHGVMELPLAQQTSVRSLDNVMVAVMGVYVKYREDLHRIFCETAGWNRLMEEFSRYFELSADREELVLCMQDVQGGIEVVERAMSALESLQEEQL